MSKYAFGILEPRADNTFWIVTSGPSNTDVYTAFAYALDYHYGDDFNIAGILASLKEADGIDSLAVGTSTPSTDHTYHVYDAQEQTVSLYHKNDEDDLLVTFPLKQWVNKYPF